MASLAQLTFNIVPANTGCRLLVNGEAVELGAPLGYPIGSTINLSLELVGGYELDNWNNGEWFEPDWPVEVTADAAFTAYLSQ